MNNLIKYGATPHFFAEAKEYPQLFLARVIAQYKDQYRIVTDSSDGLAEVSGKFRHEISQLSDYPAVGDFVMVDREYMDKGNGIVHKVLARKSAFERSSVSHAYQSQIIATNIDTVFICMSLNNDYNLSRLERYLAVGWDSGATPVVVLTKSDLCGDLPAVMLEIASVAIGVEIVPTSSHDESSYQALVSHLKPGLTTSFIGSSGVGKSTLINLLAGKEVMETSGIRQDDKGRHTTTRRELVVLPQGGIVIDTPGMRELGVESADFSKSFQDIEDLVANCKFKNCSHTVEPGCGILTAIKAGSLDKRRYENYQKLQKEVRYEGLSSKQIEAEKINSMFGGMNEMKNFKNYYKAKNKR